MTATDYKHTASCAGCVAAVDNYPPRAKIQCGTSNFGSVITPSDLNTESFEGATETKISFMRFRDLKISKTTYQPTTTV